MAYNEHTLDRYPKSPGIVDIVNHTWDQLGRTMYDGVHDIGMDIRNYYSKQDTESPMKSKGKIKNYLKNMFNNSSDINRYALYSFLTSFAANYLATNIAQDSFSVHGDALKNVSFISEFASYNGTFIGLLAAAERDKGKSYKQIFKENIGLLPAGIVAGATYKFARDNVTDLLINNVGISEVNAGPMSQVISIPPYMIALDLLGKPFSYIGGKAKEITRGVRYRKLRRLRKLSSDTDAASDVGSEVSLLSKMHNKAWFGILGTMFATMVGTGIWEMTNEDYTYAGKKVEKDKITYMVDYKSSQRIYLEDQEKDGIMFSPIMADTTGFDDIYARKHPAPGSHNVPVEKSKAENALRIIEETRREGNL